MIIAEIFITNNINDKTMASLRSWSMRLILSAGIVLLLIVLMMINISAKTITVGDDETAEYNSIQDAIGNADDGDTILLLEGVYHENLILNKTIMLTGSGNTTIVGNGTSTILVKANGVTINSTTISHSYTGTGILVHAENVEVNNCFIQYAGDGIRVEESDDIRLINNEIRDNDNGIVVGNQCGNITITGNIISHNNDGIVFDHIPKDFSPTPRAGSACAYDSLRDQVTIFGGYSIDSIHAPRTYEDETWNFDIRSESWSKITCEISPPPLKYCGLVYSTQYDCFILFGGAYESEDDGNNGLSDETWYFYPENLTWEKQPSEQHPSARSTMGFDIHDEGSIIYLYGGYGGDPRGSDIYLDDTWCYFIENGTWKELSPMTTPDRKLGGGLVFDSERNKPVWFGGKQRSNGNNINNTWEYDITSNEWYEVADLNPPSPRRYPNAYFDRNNQRMMVFGGYDNHGLSVQEIWAYDPGENAWVHRTPLLSPAGRRLASSTSIGDGKGFLFGGIGNFDRIHGDTWIYNYHKNSWTPIGICAVINNRFINNTVFGINVTADTQVPYDSTRNYWGNDSGPYHLRLNPLGGGDTISDNLAFSPWYDEKGDLKYFNHNENSENDLMDWDDVIPIETATLIAGIGVAFLVNGIRRRHYLSRTFKEND